MIFFFFFFWQRARALNVLKFCWIKVLSYKVFVQIFQLLIIQCFRTDTERKMIQYIDSFLISNLIVWNIMEVACILFEGSSLANDFLNLELYIL